MTPDKRTLGAYYSPEPYARALVKWALNGTPQKLMDPSFGGCAFLRVALDELNGLGEESPEHLVYGTDIDAETAQWTSHLVSSGVPTGNLLSSDFLTLTPGREFPLVGALVGNPPYVRHHRLTKEAVSAASSAMRSAATALNGRANLWAYFVIHAARFIEPGGRMALLLPGSVLQAEYAQPVLAYLAENFRDVLLIRIGERVFEEAQEETVVLLASGAQEGTTKVRTTECRGLSELSTLLSNSRAATQASSAYSVDWKRSLLDDEGRDLFDGLQARSESLVPLGSLAEIRIGTVTGANDFFITTLDDVSALELDDHATEIIARSAWLTSSKFDATDLELKTDSGQRTRLLTLPPNLDLSKHPMFWQRVRDAEHRQLHLRTKCNRDPWWSLGPIRIPDAFLPYMGSSYRGLVRNLSRSASTNAIHQIEWRPKSGIEERSAAIDSSWSAVSALSAELYGRSYGGGVLKVEPSAAKKLLVLTNLRMPNLEGAGLGSRATADLAMAEALRLTITEQEIINRNLEKLIRRRSLQADTTHDVDDMAQTVNEIR